MNLLNELPEDLHHEVFETILQTGDIHLQRIISKGHVTPEGEWYDQNKNEWLTLLTGSATILFADGQEITLKPGDQLVIPAHRRHRVSKTAEKHATIWLALHYSPQKDLSRIKGDTHTSK